MANNGDTCPHSKELCLSALRKIEHVLRDISAIISSDEYCMLQLLERVDDRLTAMDDRLTAMDDRLAAMDERSEARKSAQAPGNVDATVGENP